MLCVTEQRVKWAGDISSPAVATETPRLSLTAQELDTIFPARHLRFVRRRGGFRRTDHEKINTGALFITLCFNGRLGFIGVFTHDRPDKRLFRFYFELRRGQ